MNKRILMLIVALVAFGLVGNVFAVNLGTVSGSWEAKGHWETAGDIGVVCEQRNKTKPFKVKVYRAAGHLYQEYTDFRFWPNSCNVSTAELQAKWGGLGTIVEDLSFHSEGKEKKTLKRWFIQ